MRLYKSYLIKNLFKPFIISLTTLTAMIWSSRIVKYMNYIVQDGAEFLTFFKMTIYVLPSLILTILPLAIFLTAILTYNKLIENREIIILKNCGIKKIQLLSPLIILAVALTIFSYGISLYVSYKSNLAIRKLRLEIQNNISFSIIKDGVFSKFKNLIIYADKKEGDIAYNIVIYSKASKTSEKNIFLQAEKAIIDGNIITLYNGNFQRFTYSYKDAPEILFFKEYNVDFNELSGEKSNLVLKIDSFSTLKLIDILKNFDNYKDLYKKEKVMYELNYRLSFPLIVMVLSLLSGSLMLKGTFNRVSNSKVVSQTSIASMFTYILLLSLIQKIADGIIYLYILYIVILAIVIFSFYLIKEKKVIC